MQTAEVTAQRCGVQEHMSEDEVQQMLDVRTTALRSCSLASCRCLCPNGSSLAHFIISSLTLRVAIPQDMANFRAHE